MFVAWAYNAGTVVRGINEIHRYTALLSGFWLVPLAVLFAGATRLLPQLLVRRR